MSSDSEDLNLLKNEILSNKKLNNSKKLGIPINLGISKTTNELNTIDNNNTETNKSLPKPTEINSNNINSNTLNISNQSNNENNQSISNNQTKQKSKKRKKKSNSDESIPVPHQTKKLNISKKNQSNDLEELENYNNITDDENHHSDENNQLSEFQDNDDEINKWWLKEVGHDLPKWQTLEHKGPIFPQKYVPHGVKIKYKDSLITLPPPVEELATCWAKIIHTNWAKDESVQKNFFIDFKNAIDTHMKKCKIKHFEKCDFTPIRDYLNSLSKKDKEMYYEKKQSILLKLPENQHLVNCKFDGYSETLRNVFLPSAKILLSSTYKELSGRVLQPPEPEEIMINIGREAKPPSPPKGHKWGSVIHNQQVLWIARWYDKVTKRNCTIIPGSASSQHAKEIYKRFEDARQFNRIRKSFRAQYTSQLKDPNMLNRKIATILYFTERFTIRPGNFNGKAEPSLGGIISVTSKNITLNPPNEIIFKIKHGYTKDVEMSLEVEDQVFTNIRLFLSLVKEEDHIFKGLSNHSLPNTMKNFASNLTTTSILIANINISIQKYLQETPEKFSNDEKIKYLKDSVLKVINECNIYPEDCLTNSEEHFQSCYMVRVHKFNRRRVRRSLVSRFPTVLKTQPQLEDPESDLDDEWCKDYIQQKASEDRIKIKQIFETKGSLPKNRKYKQYDNLEEILDHINLEESTLLEELQMNEYNMPDKLSALKSQLDELDRQILTAKTAISSNTKENFILRTYTRMFDPRIFVAWGKCHKIALSQFLPKMAVYKYRWAADTSTDFKF